MTRLSPDMITLLMATGEVLCASDSSVSLFGYRPEEVTGHLALEFIHPDDHNEARNALRTVLDAPGTHHEMDVRVRRGDGEWVAVACSISNLREIPRVQAVVATCRPTAPIEKAAEALPIQPVDVTPQFEDFAYAVAHDLREPLRTISMFTEILLRRTELDAQGKELARNIVDGVKRMEALFDGLHALAIHRSDEPAKPVDVSRVVAQVLRDVGQAVTFSGAVVSSGPLPFVHGRESDLTRIFQNLITNAIRYRGDAPPRINISAEAAGNNWIVSVRDNGVGIPAEHRERVFMPFERLHGRSIPGVGIGLSICRKLIESMGGRIWVKDSPRTGATFCFTIPAAGEELHSSNGNRRTVPPAAAHAKQG